MQHYNYVKWEVGMQIEFEVTNGSFTLHYLKELHLRRIIEEISGEL